MSLSSLTGRCYFSLPPDGGLYPSVPCLHALRNRDITLPLLVHSWVFCLFVNFAPLECPALFVSLQKYFPDNLRSSQAAHQKMGTLERAEKARKILLQEYFSSTSRVPELEGFLHLKDGYKKSWKKVYCILRASGLYYSTKGKQKVWSELTTPLHACNTQHLI